MKNKYLKYFGILIIVVFQGCNFADLNFEQGKERFRLNDFTKKSITNYNCHGSHTIDGVPVSTNFTIGSKSASILKLGHGLSKSSIEYSQGNVFSRFYGSYIGVNGAYYDLNYYYSSDQESDIKKISFYSDGKIYKKAENDSISSFHTEFKEFSVMLNHRENIGIYAKSWDYGPDTRDADILFYNKNEIIYLIILTSSKQGEKVEEGFLLDYF